MVRSHDIWKTIIIMNLVYDNYYSSNGFNIAWCVANAMHVTWNIQIFGKVSWWVMVFRNKIAWWVI